jgi:hypothetical protein
MILPREHSGKRARNLEDVGWRWPVVRATGFSRLLIDLMGHYGNKKAANGGYGRRRHLKQKSRRRRLCEEATCQLLGGGVFATMPHPLPQEMH